MSNTNKWRIAAHIVLMLSQYWLILTFLEIKMWPLFWAAGILVCSLILSLLAAKHSHKLLGLLPVEHLFSGFVVLCCTVEVLLTLSFKVNLTFFTFENQRNYFLTWHRLTAGYHSHQVFETCSTLAQLLSWNTETLLPAYVTQLSPETCCHFFSKRTFLHMIGGDPESYRKRLRKPDHLHTY